MWEAQKEIQRIHQEVMEPELTKQAGKDRVNISFSAKEFEDLMDFMVLFAYD